MILRKSTFRKNMKKHEFWDRFWLHFWSCVLDFSYLFRYRFFDWFLMNFGSKSVWRNHPRGHHFGDLFRTSIFDWFYDAFWSLLGSPRAPFWAPRATLGNQFWYIFLHFGTLLALFWLLLAPFSWNYVASGVIFEGFRKFQENVHKKFNLGHPMSQSARGPKSGRRNREA